MEITERKKHMDDKNDFLKLEKLVGEIEVLEKRLSVKDGLITSFNKSIKICREKIDVQKIEITRLNLLIRECSAK